MTRVIVRGVEEFVDTVDADEAGLAEAAPQTQSVVARREEWVLPTMRFRRLTPERMTITGLVRA